MGKGACHADADRREPVPADGRSHYQEAQDCSAEADEESRCEKTREEEPRQEQARDEEQGAAADAVQIQDDDCYTIGETQAESGDGQEIAGCCFHKAQGQCCCQEDPQLGQIPHSQVTGRPHHGFPPYRWKSG